MLEKDLKRDLKKAIKSRSVEKRMTIKMILGEIPRLNKKKHEQVTEKEINTIVKQLIKSELVMIKYAEIDATKSEYLSVLKSYLLPSLSENEIKLWVVENVNFNDYKNKMQAIGSIMKGLNGAADGNTVKKVLMELK